MRWTIIYNTFLTNLFGILYTKLYQNRPSFTEDLMKTFWLIFSLGHGVWVCPQFSSTWPDGKRLGRFRWHLAGKSILGCSSMLQKIDPHSHEWPSNEPKDLQQRFHRKMLNFCLLYVTRAQLDFWVSIWFLHVGCPSNLVNNS